MKQLKSHVRHDDPEIMSISHIHVLLLSSAISLIVSLTLPSRFPVLVLKLPITSVHLLTLLLLICFTLGKCFLAMEVPPSSWLCPHRSSWLSGTSSHAQVGSNVVRDLLKGIFFVRIQWLVVILMSFLHLNLTFGLQVWWSIEARVSELVADPHGPYIAAFALFNNSKTHRKYTACWLTTTWHGRNVQMVISAVSMVHLNVFPYCIQRSY